MEDLAVKTTRLYKEFGRKRVLQDINIDIKKGEAVAFTGRNGSGKSTLLKLMGGLTKASGGEILREPALKIGYIPERFDKLNFTIPEYLFGIGRIDGLSRRETELVSRNWYELFSLGDMLSTPMKFLSKGTLQKVAVIQALLVQPDILLLDEPLSGQDYISQKKFAESMLELKKRNVTIIMSCHETYFIEQLADRVFHIENGHMSEVSFCSENKELPFYMMLFQNRHEDASAVLEKLKEYYHIHEISQTERIVRIISEKEKAQEIVLFLLQNHFSLLKFEEI